MRRFFRPLAVLLAAALSANADAQQPAHGQPTVIPIPSRRNTPAVQPVQGKGPETPLINTLTGDPFYSLERDDRPPATDIRDASGRPGPHYWQQRADYVIRAVLDTGAKPAGYTVAGSGTLRNASDVLSGDEQTRLARALVDTGIVPIVTDSEARVKRSRVVPGTKTWHFVAQNIRDIAWATAPDLRWDAAQCGTARHAVLCQALYGHRAAADWTRAAEETRFSIRHYSELLVPYPYPQATSIAGPSVGGMEYPMVTFDDFGGDEPDDVLRRPEPRARPSMVPDARRLERAALRLDG